MRFGVVSILILLPLSGCIEQVPHTEHDGRIHAIGLVPGTTFLYADAAGAQYSMEILETTAVSDSTLRRVPAWKVLEDVTGAISGPVTSYYASDSLQFLQKTSKECGDGICGKVNQTDFGLGLDGLFFGISLLWGAAGGEHTTSWQGHDLSWKVQAESDGIHITPTGLFSFPSYEFPKLAQGISGCSVLYHEVVINATSGLPLSCKDGSRTWRLIRQSRILSSYAEHSIDHIGPAWTSLPPEENAAYLPLTIHDSVNAAAAEFQAVRDFIEKGFALVSADYRQSASCPVSVACTADQSWKITLENDNGNRISFSVSQQQALGQSLPPSVSEPTTESTEPRDLFATILPSEDISQPVESVILFLAAHDLELTTLNLLLPEPGSGMRPMLLVVGWEEICASCPYMLVNTNLGTFIQARDFPRPSPL